MTTKTHNYGTRGSVYLRECYERFASTGAPFLLNIPTMDSQTWYEVGTFYSPTNSNRQVDAIAYYLFEPEEFAAIGDDPIPAVCSMPITASRYSVTTALRSRGTLAATRPVTRGEE